MSDFLDLLERDLVDAARRRRDARRAAIALRLRGRFGPGRAVALVAALVLAGSATAAATYAVLRGSVLPGPDARAVPPDQLPEPGTSRLSGLQAADPQAGVPPWTLRVARSTTGVCTTVGQVQDGRIGLVGLDGRFRAFDEQTVDGCGEVGRAQPLIGARVFAADRPAGVRTVVNGVAGDQVRDVVVATEPGGRRPIPVGDGGTFVAALRGYPEDVALEVELSYADGRVRAFLLGKAEGIVLDPEGGPAWKPQLHGVSDDARRCVAFGPAREFGLGISPHACGLMDARRPRGAFFAVRRMEPGPRRRAFGRFWEGRGNWRDRPARTAMPTSSSARCRADEAPPDRRPRRRDDRRRRAARADPLAPAAPFAGDPSQDLRERCDGRLVRGGKPDRCAQLGRIHEGRFGWIDARNVFRPAGIVWRAAPILCGSLASALDREPLVEVLNRMTDPTRSTAAPIQSVVWGLAGADGRVELEVDGVKRTVPRTRNGAVLVPLSGDVRRRPLMRARVRYPTGPPVVRDRTYRTAGE